MIDLVFVPLKLCENIIKLKSEKLSFRNGLICLGLV